MVNLRNVSSLIVAMTLLQLGGGLLGVIVPLDLASLGASDLVIGIVASIFSAGFMLGAWYSPQLLQQIGNIRAFSAAAALNAATVLMSALYPNEISWAVLRFLQGACFAVMFASAESWMTETTEPSQRGSVLGVYFLITKIALLVGPFVAAGQAPLSLQPYIWCAIFMALALLPVCVTRYPQPAPPDTEPFPVRRMIIVAPAAVTAAFVAGLSNTGLLALIPIYAVEIAPDNAVGLAAVFMAAAWAGGILTQWPAGLISDRIDRRLVVAGLGAMAGCSALALAILGRSLPTAAIIGLLGLWGGGALSFYGIAVAHGADRAKHSQIARMMSGLLFVWAAGSVIGPILFGLVMSSPFGSTGLFVLEVAIIGVLVALMVVRLNVRDTVSDDDREAYELAQPTSISYVEADVRTDPEHAT